MQTMYYTTRNFIRHEGNVVDLSEYRRKLEACSGFEAVPSAWEEEERPARREAFSLLRLPDLCATLAIVVMAATVVARFF